MYGNEYPQEALGTPALAFVRAVCEVLGLDSAVEGEVAVLRRNLLRLAHTREFAPAAAFKARTCLCIVAMFACCVAIRRLTRGFAGRCMLRRKECAPAPTQCNAVNSSWHFFVGATLQS